MHWNEAWDFDEYRQIAKQFADKLKQQSPTGNVEYSFNKILFETIKIPTNDAWLAIDKLGWAVNKFANSRKHQPDKAALGLPKQIHGPNRTPIFPRQTEATHQPPLKLKREFDRFAAPIWYHFEPSGNGLKLNILAFPSSVVVKEDVSRTMLQNLLEHLQEKLTPNLFTAKSGGFTPNTPRTPSINKPIIAKSGGIKAGDKITGTLLEEKTKKGGWKVETKELAIGSIQNSGDVPPDKKIGDTVNLEVRIAQTGGGGAQFKWIP